MDIIVTVKQKIVNGVSDDKVYDVSFIRRYESNGLFQPSPDYDYINRLTAEQVRQLATELPEKLLKALEV